MTARKKRLAAVYACMAAFAATLAAGPAQTATIGLSYVDVEVIDPETGYSGGHNFDPGYCVSLPFEFLGYQGFLQACVQPFCDFGVVSALFTSDQTVFSLTNSQIECVNSEGCGPLDIYFHAFWGPVCLRVRRFR